MGGTGFVSGTLARYLILKNHDVFIFTRGLKKVNYAGLKQHIAGDRRNQADLEVLKKNKFDVVFDISGYGKDDVGLLLDNIEKDHLAQYVFCSSGAVYLPSKDYLWEFSPIGYNPFWGDYGTNKKNAEDYLFEKSVKLGFKATIFRPSYIYGAGNNLYREAYIFDRILGCQRIPVPAEGNVKVQFIYIDDIVNTFVSVIGTERGDSVYNLTFPEEITWKDYLNIAMEVIGKKIEITEISHEKLINNKITSRDFFPFRNMTYLMNTDKLQKSKLFFPEINLREGLRMSYQFYKNRKHDLFDGRMNKMEEVLHL